MKILDVSKIVEGHSKIVEKFIDTVIDESLKWKNSLKIILYKITGIAKWLNLNTKFG